MGRTHLTITVELVHGSHTGDPWPRPGRVVIASRSATFEQLATAIDDAFARWDRNHLHEFTLADGTIITPHPLVGRRGGFPQCRAASVRLVARGHVGPGSNRRRIGWSVTRAIMS